ncbi:YpdA family putative bacillithiol disulfide reductase [Sporosarcina sp. HYO08]|uniref:YpdA family putative bacillithiol disulfide reductase n=1 Tax=Sporosarcina sp. HYO08 TaxID=1759557 RepID=UPI0007952A6C|nr:YpdA family putative bacillithiol disulfide reductase [Sporosarcina sp. HYO08]KXH82040.1 hypothetical protein AU377_07250 [Sporosarcina sp. HYO08]
MIQKDVIIVGGGPCGLSAAIEIQKLGLDVLVIEKGNIVNSIYNYPTHQTFFSSSIKLSIGDIPFITAKEKPKRNDALVYYRHVAEAKGISINSFEKVEDIVKQSEYFRVVTSKAEYAAKKVVVATGYYDQPNMLNVEGEELPHVFHYFKEAHPYFQQQVAIIGGKNSAIDAAIELVRAGAEVTVVYRGSTYSPSIKPWILPEFDSLVRSGKINMLFNANVVRITESSVLIEQEEKTFIVPSDAVFAMIGYHPDYYFFEKIGIEIDSETGQPIFNEETMETTVEGLYIAGVIAAGNNANKIFIENGRFHGEQIAQSIKEKRAIVK